MELAEGFLKKCKKRFPHLDKFIPHSSNLGPNLYADCMSNSELSESVYDFGVGNKTDYFTASFPLPLNDPNPVDKSILNGTDPSRWLVREKCKFDLNTKKCLQTYRGYFSRKCPMNLQEFENQISEISEYSNHISIDRNVAFIADIMSQDPDPYFCGRYNYYYGGTVSIVKTPHMPCIVYPQLNYPYKLSFLYPQFMDGIYLEKDVKYVDHCMDTSHPLLQIDSFGDTLLIRGKKQTGVFKLNYFETGVSLDKLFLQHSKDVIISASLNEYKTSELAVHSPHLIHVYDISRKVEKLAINLDFMDNSDFWGNAHFTDENTLIFCNRESINLFDLRCAINASSIRQWYAGSVTNECEKIFATAKGKSLHYVSTSHNILSLDFRKGWLQRWSHGLPQSPSLLTIAKNQPSFDLLFVGCQISGLVACISNGNYDDFMFNSVKAPTFRLPSLTETLHQSRILGHGLSHLISSRYQMSLTGLVADCSFRDRSVTVFLANSIGDVFAQTVNFSDVSDNSFKYQFDASELSRIKHWESKVLEQYTNINLEVQASNTFPCQHFEHLFYQDSKPIISKKKYFDSGHPWVKSKQYLSKCCDSLAPKLLSAWHILEDDEWCENSKDVETHSQDSSSYSDHSEEDVETRVKNWLLVSKDQSDVNMLNDNSNVDTDDEL